MANSRPTSFSRNPEDWPEAPVILLTGGNSGVGFGIALRLLEQLSRSRATDLQTAVPSAVPHNATSAYSTPNGLTLIIAARNAVKAHKACTELLRSVGKKRPVSGLDTYRWKQKRKIRVMSNSSVDRSGLDVSELAKQPLTEAEYEESWLGNLRIEFVPLDLASVDSILACSQEVRRRYPYITHLMLNAGCGPFVGIDWLGAIKQVCADFLDALTRPTFTLERLGQTTEDGLGWTFQCNVFGHYMLARELLPLLYKSRHSEPRISWTGSLDGLPEKYDREDYQAMKNSFSYHATKFQSSLVAWGFNEKIAEYEAEHAQEAQGKHVRSFLVHPGVVAGNMFVDILGVVLDFAMKLSFYLARLLGSPHHVIAARKAAVAFVYVALAPFSLLALHLAVAQNEDDLVSLAGADKNIAEKADPASWAPLRFGARCTRSGREYVGIDAIGNPAPGTQDDTWVNQDLAVECVERCETLRKGFLRVREERSNTTR